MSELLMPFAPKFTLIIPDSPMVIAGWVIWLIILVFLALSLRDRAVKFNRSSLLWLASLSVLILILTPFIGVFPRMSPIIGPGEAPFRKLMFFAAIPWMVGAGVLGLLPATLLAGFSGLLLAYLDTHNIFTPLVTMSVAVLYSWCLQQRYRTNFYKLVRFPMIAGVVSLLLTAPSVFFALVLSAPGPIAARVGMAINRFPMMLFSLGGMVFIGGAVCVIVQALAQKSWIKTTPLKPAPGEVHFKYRLLGYAVPIFVMVLAGVLVGSWSLGQSYGRRQTIKQLTNSVGIATESLSVFLKTGDQLLDTLALNPLVVSGSADEISTLLEQTLRKSTFFNGLALFDEEGNLVVGVPPDLPFDVLPNFDDHPQLAADEQPDTMHLITGRTGGEKHSSMSFVTRIEKGLDDPQYILWGQAQLDENDFAQALLATGHVITQQGGSISVVGSDGIVLYHRNGEGELESLPSTNLASTTFYQSTSGDGQPLLNYYQPVAGTDWGLVATLPALIIQETAWVIARTNLLIATTVMVLIFVGVWIGFTPLINELEAMAVGINRVVMGEYDLNQLEKRVYPKRGYLQAAFKNMIGAQRKRMDQQEKLFSVGTRIAHQVKLADSLQMILSAALLDGMCAVRIVVVDSNADLDPPVPENRFGIGQQARLLAPWDHTVENLVLKDGHQVLNRDEIGLRLPFLEGKPEISSVVMFPLKWKDLHLGVLWAAYQDNYAPDGGTVTYLKQLAQIASLAIVNARTQRNFQLSSALMTTIFDLLPDAVVIADQHDRILLHNANAKRLLVNRDEHFAVKRLSDLFSHLDLSQLNLNVEQAVKAKEINLHDGRAYELTYSPIQIDGGQSAKALILKDLTTQRKADALKSEFVTMVSHELRSPLTLILGYAKILRLTGNLNEQQDVYINNMVENVEEMQALVQKLLDIGRLEDGDPLEIVQISAEQLINRAVDSLSAKAKQKNIRVNIDLPEAPIAVVGDQIFLVQALKNLLDNGIKFSKMGGEVTIRAKEKNERVIFAVQDNGIGIAPLDQRNLFKKFSRISSNAGGDDEGSGLGLAIVKSIAERHGGEVRIESQLGKGSTFFFDIPCR
ncbi:MAG: hypothetical protein GX142_07580 [Chloroflexi bacterium]|nr:hypothetical protein [Chloroflexota bacterium]